MVKTRKYVYVKKFHGEPKRTDLEIVEEDLQPIKDGEFLAEAKYLSVDPYMRTYTRNTPIGSDMFGGQIAEVIDSKNDKFPKKSLVYGHFGWRTHMVVNPKAPDKPLFPTYVLPDFGNHPPSIGLGVLGMPGNSAHFGVLEVCQPKEGETLVVTCAGGAVGSTVGQIARMKGCKVIGFTGSDEKCKWLKEELGFDHAINYKTADVEATLKETIPNGVDCYFDNVGGELASTIIAHMNKHGRVCKCGSISTYNLEKDVSRKSISRSTIQSKRLKIKIFSVTNFNNRWQEGIAQNLKWIDEGKLKYKEHITEGFENMFDAFLGMLRGENMGKAIVRV